MGRDSDSAPVSSAALSSLPARHPRLRAGAWCLVGWVGLVTVGGAAARAFGAGGSDPWLDGASAGASEPSSVALALTAGPWLVVAWLVVLCVGAVRAREPRGALPLFAGLALAFGLLDAVVPRVLGALALAAEPASPAARWLVAAHLTDTLLVAASLVLAAAEARHGQAAILPRHRAGALLALGLVLLVGVSAIGAAASLGDTSLFASAEFSPAPFELPTGALVLRWSLLHAVSATLVIFYLVYLCAFAHDRLPATAGLAQFVSAIAVTQLLVGVAGVWLASPPWLGVAHLGLALGLWVSLTALYAAANVRRPFERSPTRYSIYV